MLLKKFPDKKAFKKMAQKYNVIPVCTRILADTFTPVSILKKLYNKKDPIFLLESVEAVKNGQDTVFLEFVPKAA